MKLTLATKIAVGFCLVLAVFTTVAITGITQLNAIRRQLNALNRGFLPLNRAATDIDHVQETSRTSLDSILKFNDPAQQIALFESHRRTFARNMFGRLDRARVLVGRIDRDLLSERDLSFMDNLLERIERIREQTTRFDTALGGVLDALGRQDLPVEELDQMPEYRQTGRQLARETRLAMLSTRNMITTRMLMAERDESSAIQIILWLTILAGVIGAAITGLSIWALNPVKRLTEAARHISRGEFTHTVDIAGEDEFGLLATEFNRMAGSLAMRQRELDQQQSQLEQVNRQLRQSSIDLALMKLYNEHIIRSMHNAVLVADPLGQITTINPAAEALWQLDPEQTIDRKLGDLPIASSLDLLLQEWAKVLRDKKRLEYKALAFETNRRGTIMVDVYVSPLLDTEGDIQGVLLVGEDVTEEIRTKQALLQSERMATIGRMSAMVAHEIRNPLSSIGLNTELLEEELVESAPDLALEARTTLKAISREVERLTEVTEEYLRFARLPKPNLVPTDVHELLADLLSFYHNEFQAARIQIERHLDSDHPTALADEGQLRQAFLNLIKNAIESMNAGGTLTIASERQGDRLLVKISDTGKGIDKDSIHNIFDPFFSTREGGTGLGLSLTQQIISEHNGEIRCESQEGNGTRFTISLSACETTKD